MKRSRFSEEQIIGILKEHQAGLGAKALCRKHRIALAITGQGDALAKIGCVLAVLSMALFAFTVLRNGVGETNAQPIGSTTQPAE